MASAIPERALCQQSMANLSEFVANHEHLGLTSKLLKQRLEYLESNWRKFRAAHRKILRVLDVDRADDQATVFSETETAYLSTSAALQQRIDILESHEQTERESEGASGSEDEQQSNDEWSTEHDQEPVRVPGAYVRANVQPEPERVQEQPQLQPIVVQWPGMGKIENTWGEFNGELTKWKGFHDRFKIAVHENSAIAKVFKFQHLRNSLKGWAASALGDWEQTEDNYDEAWERLNQLYNRPYQTSKELLDKFHALPKLDRPTGGMIQKFSNTTHEVVRQLRALGYPVEHFDLFFVHGIHERLDGETSKQWELKRTSETPKLMDLLDFLDHQAKAMFISSIVAKDNRKRAQG